MLIFISSWIPIDLFMHMVSSFYSVYSVAKTDSDIQVEVRPFIHGMDRTWSTFRYDVMKKRQELESQITDDKKDEYLKDLFEFSEGKIVHPEKHEMDRVSRYLLNLREYKRFCGVYNQFSEIRTRLTNMFTDIAEEDGFQVYRKVHQVLSNACTMEKVDEGERLLSQIQ